MRKNKLLMPMSNVINKVGRGHSQEFKLIYCMPRVGNSFVVTLIGLRYKEEKLSVFKLRNY